MTLPNRQIRFHKLISWWILIRAGYKENIEKDFITLAEKLNRVRSNFEVIQKSLC